MLASLLAEHYRGTRSVYGLHGPVTAPIGAPPYFVGLSEDLTRLDHELPNLLIRAESDREPVAEFPGGLHLLSFELDRPEARRGELAGFCVRWRTESPLSGEMFGVRLLPGKTGVETDWQQLSKKGRFVQGFPVVYGLRGLAPSPAGTVYEQEGRFIVPSNAPPGEYAVQVAFAPSYPPEYEQWVDAGVGNVLLVRPHPLPTNGP
jgi:hypothetical protein